jgi:TAT (twin-arginine translocation) pathway signal sequence
MATQVEVNRREFLKTGGAGSAVLVLGFYLPSRKSRIWAAQAVSSETSATLFKPNAWIRITPDSPKWARVREPQSR